MTSLAERLTLAMAGPPKVSQAELARACGISPPSVSDWLSGKTKSMDGANLLKAAKRLQVRPEWLADGSLPMQADAASKSVAEPERPPYSPRSLAAKLARPTTFMVPRLDVRAGQGNGVMIRDVVEIIDHVEINVAELCRVRGISVTSPANLRIITGYGPSMRPTFDHLDQLLIDTGIADIKVDDIYCLEDDEELYIKRLQRVPGRKNTFLMISDNKDFENFTIEDPLRSGFRVHGRVVAAIKIGKV